MNELKDFENSDRLNYVPPALPMEDIKPNTTRFPNLTENDIDEIKNS